MPDQRAYPQTPDKVYFFATCLVDLFYPEAGLAGMQLLRRAGVEVLFPRDQTCCGQPAWNSGYREQALAVARTQLDCFRESIPVVVPSPSCAGMLHNHYPALFRGEADEAQATALAGRTYELTGFLVHALGVTLEDLGEPERIALHCSCSARREMGVDNEHVALLNQLANVELVEPDRARECCGFGGTFAVKHAEISATMVADKADAICATGANRLLSGDCGCLMNIGGHLQHRGERLPAQHIASYLWERTRGPENE